MTSLPNKKLIAMKTPVSESEESTNVKIILEKHTDMIQ
jgi:hypothetical protein